MAKMRNFKRKKEDKVLMGTYSWEKLSSGDYLLFGNPTVKISAEQFGNFCNQLAIAQAKGKIRNLKYFCDCCFFEIVQDCK